MDFSKPFIFNKKRFRNYNVLLNKVSRRPINYYVFVKNYGTACFFIKTG